MSCRCIHLAYLQPLIQNYSDGLGYMVSRVKFSFSRKTRPFWLKGRGLNCASPAQTAGDCMEPAKQGVLR